jgi:hypothetical protein
MLTAFFQTIMRIGLLSLLFTTHCFSHHEWVHQYIVRQAWELLKQQYPAIENTEMANRVGSVGWEATDPCLRDWIKGTITYGAWREDISDPIDLRTGTAAVSVTHFWNADRSDYLPSELYLGQYKNANTKASQYWTGSGWYVVDLYKNPSGFDQDPTTETFSKIGGGTV